MSIHVNQFLAGFFYTGGGVAAIYIAKLFNLISL